ncbi:MAG: hypothetical protein JW955_05490 [Sedimentisphaerales bacterium]|nr:hypothetical protein [Sedimentisphaerales bacterium]
MYRRRLCLMALALSLVFAAGASADVVKGKVLVQYWFGGPVNDNLDNLKASADFPNNPLTDGQLDSFSLPDQAAWDYFGVRITGWLTPPTSGDYTFWTTSDDDSEVWLSTDDTADNLARICNVEGWMNYEDWTYTSGSPGTSYKSAPVYLEAGQRYFMQVLMSDGTGGGCVGVGWAGPGIEGPTPIASEYLESEAPVLIYIAKDPSPANGEKDVVAGLFTWTPGQNAKADDIYMGTSPDLGAADFQGKQPSSMALFFYPGILEPGVTYYWRVDTTDTSNVLHTGKVWSFTVMPAKATEPSPMDGALGQSVTPVLSWKAGQNFPMHSVYLGADKALVEAGDASVLVASDLVDATFEVTEALAFDTTYYWRVDELDALGDTYVGDVWSFKTTLETLGKIKREIWEGIGGTAVTDLTSSVDFPANPTWSDLVPSFKSPDIADNYGGRMSAWLHVPAAGDYTFWIASDDASELWFGATPADAKLIASVATWTGADAFDSLASQKSAVQTLGEAVYFIDALWKEGGGGDNCSVAWQGPDLPRQVIPAGFCELFVGYWAQFPKPASGATNVAQSLTLSWAPGVAAEAQDIYFGDSAAAVAAADTASPLYQGRVGADVKTLELTDLGLNKTYYWRVDEVNDVEAGSPWKGGVWSFKTADYLVIDMAQKALAYNNADSPFFTELAYDVPADWAKMGDTAALSLEFMGAAGAAESGETTIDGPGAYTLKASGADIWGTSDQFHFAYMKLTGDGSIQGRVDSVQQTNAWAKAGVMIRETLTANSKHLIMALTGGEGGGGGFQGRLTTGGNSSSLHGDITVAPPSWVKLVREGNTITAYYSADGVDWQLWTDTSPDTSGGAISNPMTLEMAETVYIGLFATSHVNATTFGTYKFSEVSVSGGVDEQSANAVDIGLGNSAQPMYVAVEDAAGAVAVVDLGNPAATTVTAWTSVDVPLASLAGLDLANVAKLSVGVGNSLAPAADGLGTVQIRNVCVAKAYDVTKPGDEVHGIPESDVCGGNSSTNVSPCGELPPLVIDNKVSTKYLNFKGDFDEGETASGFTVKLAAGPALVRGMTFTSANDSPDRDPIAFELSGSNDDGATWTVIATGDIVDFAGATDWPRQTKTTTPIKFENDVAYSMYKVLFTAIRGPASANSMQIAEVELLACAPLEKNVVFVSFHTGDNTPSSAAAAIGFTAAADKGYTDLLEANGYKVTRLLQTGSPDLAVVNAADLVIVSRSVASSSFQNANADNWNGVTAPMIVLNGYTARKSRMGYYTGTNIPDTTGDIKLAVADPAHPIFTGIAITGGVMDNAYAGLAVYPTDGTTAYGISVVTDPIDDEGTVLATLAEASGTVTAGSVLIAEWAAGATLTHDGGAGSSVLAGPRLLFLTGSRENGGKTSETAGMFDLAADGAQMFLNAVAYMCK